MIIRIVKLTLKPEVETQFREVFLQRQQLIAASEGCLDVQVYTDIKNPNVFFTISKWINEESLNRYRNSELFKETWKTVKPWFVAPAEAYSLQ